MCGILYTTIFLFIVLLILVSITNIKKESFNDYASVTQLKPPDNSCLNLLANKGWINLNDDSVTSKMRKNIIADMEATRVRQGLVSDFVYPNVDGCTIGKNVIDLYNAKNVESGGYNMIDPKTCLMKGNTIDGRMIYHQMDVIDSDSTFEPKGCMIDLSKMSKDAFDRLVDDAYQVKMFPELKEKKDYRNYMIQLSKENEELENKFLHEQAVNKELMQRLSIFKTNLSNDEVYAKCRNVSTPANETGGWTFSYLDRHNVKCEEGEVLSRFQMVSDYNPDRAKYVYRCCKLDTWPLANRLRHKVATSGSAPTNSLGWNARGLINHTVQCPDSNLLKKFQMEAIYNNPINGQAKYNTECTSFELHGLPTKELRTECRKMRTAYNDEANTFNVLDRHDIKCNDGEGISDFTLRSNGAQLFYEYSCCAPKIVSK